MYDYAFRCSNPQFSGWRRVVVACPGTCCGGVSGDMLWRRVRGRVVEACPGTCCGGVSGDVLWRRVRGRVVEACPGTCCGGVSGDVLWRRVRDQCLAVLRVYVSSSEDFITLRLHQGVQSLHIAFALFLTCG
ncbi:unnamed protein product [Gadus morhua 'NCC']